MPAPVPPFTRESAIVKVRLAEDSWNTRDPQRVCLGYTEDCRWRNRAEFPVGHSEIIAFLTPEMGQGAGLPVDQGTVGIH